MCIGEIKGEEAGVWGGGGRDSEGLLTQLSGHAVSIYSEEALSRRGSLGDTVFLLTKLASAPAVPSAI